MYHPYKNISTVSFMATSKTNGIRLNSSPGSYQDRSQLRSDEEVILDNPPFLCDLIIAILCTASLSEEFQRALSALCNSI